MKPSAGQAKTTKTKISKTNSTKQNSGTGAAGL